MGRISNIYIMIFASILFLVNILMNFDLYWCFMCVGMFCHGIFCTTIFVTYKIEEIFSEINAEKDKEKLL